MKILEPGDVVVFAFPGAINSKPRPAVVIPTVLYHKHRLDIIVGVLTSQIGKSTAPTDYVLQEWPQAGLHQPSALQSYFNMEMPSGLHLIGTLSERDWQGIQACLSCTLAIS